MRGHQMAPQNFASLASARGSCKVLVDPRFTCSAYFHKCSHAQVLVKASFLQSTFCFQG